MTELKILNHIGNHLNVVNLLGACTKPGGLQKLFHCIHVNLKMLEPSLLVCCCLFLRATDGHCRVLSLWKPVSFPQEKKRRVHTQPGKFTTTGVLCKQDSHLDVKKKKKVTSSISLTLIMLSVLMQNIYFLVFHIFAHN